MDALNRSEFAVPEWTRIIWSTTLGKQIWETRISEINIAWDTVELKTVAHGVRKAAIQFWPSDELNIRAKKVKDLGLTASVLRKEGLDPNTTSASIPFVEGQPYQYRVAITKPENVILFTQAYQANDEILIGTLLGYPSCCTAFFKDHWIGQRVLDTTWCMVRYGESPIIITEASPIECNILLRWFGVRLVPHLPCSFNCLETALFGSKIELVARQFGFDLQWEWISELLSQPMEYSTLHGAAEIKTPLFKLSVKSDLLMNKVVIRREGGIFPEGSGSGIRFPYKVLAPVKVDSRKWTDNGFITEQGMEMSHEPIYMVFSQFGLGFDNVFDLGCGNGQLLKKLLRVRPFFPMGIDCIPEKVHAARQSLKQGLFVKGLIEEAEFRPNTLVLVNPIRLAEMTINTRLEFVDKLERVEGILAYAYGNEDLNKLLSTTGLLRTRQIQAVNNGKTSCAAFLQ